MSMIIGVVAFAKDRVVFCLIPQRIGKAMSRVEMLFSVNGNFVVHDINKQKNK